MSESGPDAAEYGASEGYPIGTSSSVNLPRYIIGSYSHFCAICPTKTVDRGLKEWTFRRAPEEPRIRYSFQGGQFSLSDYLARNPITGLLIAKDDVVLAEHYQYGRSDRDLFMSQSIAKTITAMLIGIALSEGLIGSLDDAASTYVPGLRDSEYGRTSIRDLLHMSSGIACREEYNGKDDVSRLGHDLFAASGMTDAEIIAQDFNMRVAPAGTRFQYSSIDTEVLGLILGNAVRRPLSKYLSEKIWQPIQTESAACWGVDASGTELAYCCFNAVLRDYARFARLLAYDGVWQGRRVIPRQWIIDATTVQPSNSYLAPGVASRFYGYGYQVWILPGPGRMFALQGIHGQMIFIDPASKLIMVQMAARKKPVDPGDAESIALWSGLVHQLGAE
jgi:CubicO group peptidase (beta-lactamase class C family)